MGKRLKKSSASTDVEAAHAVNKATEPLQKAKRELEDSETRLNPKKQKGSDEDEKTALKTQSDGVETSDLKKKTKKMRNSFNEMIEATKKLVDLMPTKADLHDSLLKKSNKNRKTALKKESDEDEKTALKKESDEDRKTAQKKEREEDEKTALKKEIEEMTISFKEMSEFVKILQENILTKADLQKFSFKKKVEEWECCFETEGAFGNNDRTIFVKGFNWNIPRADIMSALKKHFSSCGQISRVFVPIECKTGSSLGFAFINLTFHEKALTLDGSYLGSSKLSVVMAKTRGESIAFSNHRGCVRCHKILAKHRRDSFIKTHGGLVMPRTAELTRLFAELEAEASDEDSEEDAEAAEKDAEAAEKEAEATDHG